MTEDELKKINEQIDDLENIADMLVIRKGATNGDVIRTLFGNYIAYAMERNAINNGENPDWWNSPYKADKEGD